MIRTTAELLASLPQRQPQARLRRLVAKKELIPIRRGLYETDAATAGYLLAGAVYGPSYLSFAYALGYHGLIPERVEMYTSATYRKNKSKLFRTPFGSFAYHDVPAAVYPYGVELRQENGYTWLLASPEKALCDQLYLLPPVRSLSAFQALLSEDMRLDPEQLSTLQTADLLFLAPRYHASNLALLAKWLQRRERG